MNEEEKLQIMEATWEDLRAQADQAAMPEWHKKVWAFDSVAAALHQVSAV